MSMITCFRAGTAADFESMRFGEDTNDEAVVLSKNITPGLIADLAFLLTGSRDCEPVRVRDKEGLTVYEFKKELVHALGAVDGGHLAAVADKWGVDDVVGTVNLLQRLRRLAKEAMDRDHNVYLYWTW